MIIKRRRKEYYEPPKKKKLAVWAKILIVLACVAMFFLGFYAAHPIMSLLGL